MDELLEGLLEFAAQAGVPIANIEELIASLTSLAATADTVRGAFRDMWTAVEAGARLQGLSSATGESVAKLYEFERGLDAVGRKAKYLPTIFADIQRALSVANESDRVARAFGMLDLDPDQLRRRGTVDAVMEVAGAMEKLSPNEAAWAGDQIFGKFQTQSVLAIARNMDLFQREMNESSGTGALLEQYSKVFQGIMADRGNINSDALGLRTLIAGSIAPEILEAFGNASSSSMHPENIHELLVNAKNSSPGSAHFKHEFTSLEKMGFIMSGSKVQNPFEQRKVDLLQQIAENTRQLAHASPVAMPDNKHLRDIVDPSPFISNIV